MEITKQRLIGMRPAGRLKRFISQTKNTEKPVKIVSLIGTEFTSKDLLWLAGRFGSELGYEKIMKFSCGCALVNLDRIEKYSPEFEVIKKFLKDPQYGRHDHLSFCCERAAKAAHKNHDGLAVDAARVARDVIRAGYGTYPDETAISASYRIDNETVNKLLFELYS
ncbi:hypothetical protein VPHK120G1_0021 [Vibrio phage K120 g1]